jgi:hypothetical protein
LYRQKADSNQKAFTDLSDAIRGMKKILDEIDPESASVSLEERAQGLVQWVFFFCSFTGSSDDHHQKNPNSTTGVAKGNGPLENPPSVRKYG